MTRMHWFWGILGVTVALFLHLDTIPLYDVDEGAFTEATREMLVSGNFLTTYLDGELRFDKPILIYWLQAASISLFGLTEAAARLPSVLAALGWAGLTYAFGRRHYGAEAGFWAALFLTLSLQVSLIAKAAIADALLNLWIAAALFAIYQYRVSADRRLLLGAYAAMGLGMLTKGPVAVVIPFAATFLFYASFGQWREWLRGVFHFPGWAVFLVIAGPWYALEFAAQGQAFIDGFFLKHNVSRFQGPMEGHAGSLLYFVPVLLLGTLPFTGLILRGLAPLRTLWADELARFLLLWFAFVFVFFSLSGTKLPHYIIYGYTPLFLLAARAITLGGAPRFRGLWAAAFLLFLAALPALLARLEPTGLDAYGRALLAALSAQLGTGWSLAMGAAAVLMVGIGYLAHWRTAVLASGLLMALVFHGAVLPLTGQIKQGPVREAGRLARAADAPIHLKMGAPSFLFYARRTSVDRPMQPGDWFFTKAEKATKYPPHRPIRQKHGMLLAEVVENAR